MVVYLPNWFASDTVRTCRRHVMLLKYNFRLAEKEDAPQILEYLVEHFFPQEPCSQVINQHRLDRKSHLSQALGLNSAQLRPIYASLIDRCLQFPFSTVVALETGEIIAVLLNSIWRRDDDPEEGADYEVEGDTQSENLEKFSEQCSKNRTNLLISSRDAQQVSRRLLEPGSIQRQCGHSS